MFSDLLNLQELSLCFNKLTKIDSLTFKGLDKLESLGLGENQITVIDLNFFSHILKLKCLLLYGNKMKKLDSITFKGMINLEKLRLDSNEIKEIEIRKKIRHFLWLDKTDIW